MHVADIPMNIWDGSERTTLFYGIYIPWKSLQKNEKKNPLDNSFYTLQFCISILSTKNNVYARNAFAVASSRNPI